MGVFSILWGQLNEFLNAAVPIAAQLALVYLIVRFAIAVASTLVAIAEVPKPATAPQAPAAQPQEQPGEPRPPSPQELLEQAGAAESQAALPGAPPGGGGAPPGPSG